MRPMISVVVPAYNHERYVDRAIESALGQDVLALEVIVVDDGSSDRTGDRVVRWVAADERVRYFRQENRGAHAAINAGIHLARAEVLAILNSDDMFLPGHLGRGLELLDNRPQALLVAGDVRFMDGEGRILEAGVEVDWLARARSFHAETGHLALALLHENFVATTSNMIFRRRLWERVNGFQPLRYCHDLDFLLAAVRCGEVVLDRGREHVLYRTHEANTIKENLARIRVEIAMVTAVALVENDFSALARPGEHLRRFLRAKDFSPLLAFLLGRYARLRERTAFYLSMADEAFVRTSLELLA